MEITASLVKELRERTGAGMMECKKALTEAGGDIDAAADAVLEGKAAAPNASAVREEDFSETEGKPGRRAPKAAAEDKAAAEQAPAAE